MLSEASNEYSWNLNLSEIARIWTNGCIIRSKLMEELSVLFSDNIIPVLLFPEIIGVMKSNKDSLLEIVSTGLKIECPLPVISSATNYFLGYTKAQSSANMIQAQRDYFGAHTYQRVDRSLEEYFHTNWKN